jgi:hypothetical protein
MVVILDPELLYFAHRDWGNDIRVSLLTSSMSSLLSWPCTYVEVDGIDDKI